MGSRPKDVSFLGTVSFVQRRRWSLCIPDTAVLGVQRSLPAQILSRNVLMSGSSCVLPAHALQRHPARSELHGAAGFCFEAAPVVGRPPSVPSERVRAAWDP